MRLYLVRHGQTAWNVQSRAQGHSDIPLDDVGRDQANRARAALAGVALERAISSDLLRARVTAETILEVHPTPLELDERLRERSFGAWEGEPFDVIHLMMERAVADGADPFAVRPPQGESFVDVWERLARVAEELHAEDRDTLIVTHGAACGLLMARLLGADIATARRYRFMNCGITELERGSDGAFAVKLYNECSHLDAGALAGSMDGSNR
jgi:broad specificity phosphatase PhoE